MRVTKLKPTPVQLFGTIPVALLSEPVGQWQHAHHVPCGDTLQERQLTLVGAAGSDQQMAEISPRRVVVPHTFSQLGFCAGVIEEMPPPTADDSDCGQPFLTIERRQHGSISRAERIDVPDARAPITNPHPLPAEHFKVPIFQV